ncbi:MAG: Smr/MutS family protein [Hyphomicrobium sp.]|nr:Smr/MutS family protein [Hyphomicrobium sp.]
MTKKPGRGGRPTVLSDEDHALWEHTARSLEPLRNMKGRVHEALEGEDDFAKLFAPKAKSQAPSQANGRPQSLADPLAKPPVKKSPPDLNPFDRKNVKKLKRGKIEIEARIDLHGMRQAEAHAALIRFIHGSAAMGRRWVLVITGKGLPSRSPDGDRERSFGETPRGVLKRSVPLWLAEPQVSGLIVSFTEAAIEHGGSGALYVHLRRG